MKAKKTAGDPFGLPIVADKHSVDSLTHVNRWRRTHLGLVMAAMSKIGTLSKTRLVKLTPLGAALSPMDYVLNNLVLDTLIAFDALVLFIAVSKQADHLKDKRCKRRSIKRGAANTKTSTLLRVPPTRLPTKTN
eukprot:4154509-Amphidinium_carterae.1